MNTISYLVLVIISLCIMIFITRAFPFMFGSILQHNQRIKTIGQFLPAYMMLLLAIYEINPSSFTKWPFATPALIGLFVLTLVHLWRRQVLLSLIVGTGIYLLLAWIFSSTF